MNPNDAVVPTSPDATPVYSAPLPPDGSGFSGLDGTQMAQSSLGEGQAAVPHAGMDSLSVAQTPAHEAVVPVVMPPAPLPPLVPTPEITPMPEQALLPVEPLVAAPAIESIIQPVEVKTEQSVAPAPTPEMPTPTPKPVEVTESQRTQEGRVPSLHSLDRFDKFTDGPKGAKNMGAAAEALELALNRQATKSVKKAA